MRELGANTWEVSPKDVSLPRRDRNAHKGDFGRAVILGGAVGYSGAPVLAAKAAVHTGAGLVTVLVPEPVYQIAAAKLECAMPWPLRADTSVISGTGDSISYITAGLTTGTLDKGAYKPALEKMKKADAALIGPGLSREKGAAWVSRKLTAELECPLVLDADGINALSGHIDVLDSRKGLTVLTPHDGEYARLTGHLPGEDRVGEARAFAAVHNCVLVLKGHRTVTAFPDGEAFVNTTGNPGMAKGGSGDVLSGMLVSLLAQGLEPKQAVPWGVCLHGQAGDLAAEELGEYGMTPADMIGKIPAVLKKF